jgi:hypothetical protein
MHVEEPPDLESQAPAGSGRPEPRPAWATLRARISHHDVHSSLYSQPSCQEISAVINSSRFFPHTKGSSPQRVAEWPSGQ